MKVLVLGKGSRENAIVKHLVCDNIYQESFTSINDVIFFCKSNDINLVFPSNEYYLVHGIVDELAKHNILCFGPNKLQAQLEGSKLYTKNLLQKFNIPTAPFYLPDAFYYNNNRQYVVKLDGLASGKGVFLPNNPNELNLLLKTIDKPFFIEERLYGEEFSILAFCNGTESFLMPPARDYKQCREYSSQNTGGMGAYAPVKHNISNDELKQIKSWMDLIVQHTSYKGILYMGLLKTTNGFNVLEFNCRFGDPEAQVLLELLDIQKSPLLTIILDCIQGNTPHISWKENMYATTVVLTNYLYPNQKIPCQILNLDKLDQTVNVYFGDLENGGRIASITSCDTSLMKARTNVYNNIRFLELEGNDYRYYRMDVALQELLDQPINKHINIAVLGSTNGTSALPLFQKYKKYIQLVVSNKSNAGILTKAKQNKIRNIYLPVNVYNKHTYDDELCNLFKLYDIDYIFLIGYMRYISKTMIERYPNKIFNIHPSLLPRHEGIMDLDVHQQVLNNNDIITGCTLHHVTENVDGGKIVLQSQLEIDASDTKETLKQKVQYLEQQTILNCMKLLLNSSFSTKTTYEDSGVSIDRGDAIVSFLKNNNNDIGQFCSIKKLNGSNQSLAMTIDGIGTKIELWTKYNKLYQAGFDLVAMNVNDLICHGAKPLYFLDYIATERIQDNITDLLKGIQDACLEAQCTLVGGETAEMNRIYKTNGIDIAGFAVGIIDNNDILPTNNISSGDKLYALPSSGFHANGFSLIHDIYKQDSAIDWNSILTPTRIYVKNILHVKDKVKAIAHITGGGITNNLPRVLNGKHYVLKQLHFPKVFLDIQQKTKLSYDEMLSTFNCGIGMIVVVDPSTSLPDEFFEIGYIQ